MTIKKTNNEFMIQKWLSQSKNKGFNEMESTGHKNKRAKVILTVYVGKDKNHDAI